MSRQYDETKPYSEEEERFLIAQGQDEKVRLHRIAMGQDPSTMPSLTGLEPGRGTDVPAGLGAIAPGLSPAAMDIRADGVSFAHIATEALEAELQRRYDLERDSNLSEEDAEEIQQLETSRVVESEDRPYEDWRADELRAQSKYRQLSTSGNKAELAQRLREDDEDEDGE